MGVTLGECICKIEPGFICTLKGALWLHEVLAHYDVIPGSIRRYNQFM